ncbi:MAG: Dabb family protein [Lachnospiraceae bacterium]|nr:Dabb family protein [Lachnospiraceae bacterium]
MKHYIIAKFKEGVEKEKLTAPITEIFEGTLTIPGVHGVQVKPCCINRPNRYDIMIEIDMDPDALTQYDACEAHKKWKSEYGDLLEKKTIFDSID